MARARNIKPGFFTNGDLLECQPLARLLFAGLWTEADCRGILEDRPKFIKIKVLPGDNCDVDELLSELEAAGFIFRYQVGDARCILVTNFGKHQNPHQNEKPNSLPAPDHSGASTVLAPEQHQSTPADSLLPITDSLLPSSDEDEAAPVRAGRIVATPFAYIDALCEATGIDVSELSDAVKRKQGAVAKRLQAAGMTPDDVRTCGMWLRSQTWRTHGIDLFTVEKERSAWELAGKPDRASKGGAPTQSVDGKPYWDGTQYRRADGLVV